MQSKVSSEQGEISVLSSHNLNQIVWQVVLFYYFLHMRYQLITSPRTSCLVLCVSTRFVLACVFLQPQTRNQEVKGSNATVLTHRARSVSFRCTHTLQAASQVASHDLKSSAESSAGTSEPDLNLSSSRSAASLCEINLWVGGCRFAFPQQPDALLECPQAKRQRLSQCSL